jgi:hypothetical protein
MSLIFGPAARCPTAILRHENCGSDRSRAAPASAAKKNRSSGDCMAAMSIRPGTEDADPFHLRITCANLTDYGDDFIRQ